MIKIDHGSIDSVQRFYIRRLVPMGKCGTMPPARASVHCFFFLRKGNVEIDVAERRISTTAGECLIIPMGQVFSVVSFSNDTEGYMGGFHSDLMISERAEQRPLSFIYGWLSQPVAFSGKRLVYIENIFDRIYDEWQSSDRDMSIIKVYIQALLTEMGRYRSDKSYGQTAAEKITGNFLQIISENSPVRPTVEQCGEILNITPGHLTKCVRAVTGKSPIKWIEENTMTEAKMMLYQTDMPIGEIAAKLGIEDTSYFSRMFRRCEGTTPYEYRKLIKKS